MAMMEGSAASSACDGVRIVSRRMVRPWTAAASDGETTKAAETSETVHLTPWDLQMLTVDYIQMGVLLARPAAEHFSGHMIEHLAQSLSHALALFYPYAGRLVVDQHGGGKGITVSLLCTGDGAEFVYAVADATVSDITGSLRIPRLVWSFFPLNGIVGADAAAASGSHSRPVLGVQVTELADGVFVAMSLNHGVADGSAFWHLFNTWAKISRNSNVEEGKVAAPVLGRWFPDTCPVPVPLPFPTLEHIVRRFHGPPVEECFFAFSEETVRNLKMRANAEMMTTKISSLQALLAHVWLAVTRARSLPPGQETSYTLAVGCRGRMPHVVAQQAYAGNAMVRCAARAVADGILCGGLGCAAWLLNRAVASQDEAALMGSVSSWHMDPRFAYLDGWWHPTLLVTGNSPRFDAYGNDFGWGRPVAVRSGAGNKVDGRVTVYEGHQGGIGMELCLAPEPLRRLLADHEFMAAVSR
ncbi:hypothetical protein QOZ80_9AG0671630 [Eleusine coracana subsp. coracana]|nr:hypothetical protein QOZ80_9AG0671630 [Eleusine coracana subsp. coracana]